MLKFLFFDYRELDLLEGFTRELEQPVKYPANPLFIADQPWENGNMQLYGSVIKAPKKPFQLWYSVIHKPWWIYLAYAESDDGISWRKPLFDIFKYNDQKTNIVLACDVHGPAVIYDPADPREDWRYKMMAGAAPSNCICAFHSPDGIRWQQAGKSPVICTHPDSPMGLLRLPDGRYAAYHRFGNFCGPSSGRRVCRSESWNFMDWTNDPRMVFEPDAGDPPQTQFYGMGSVPYGDYETGTLWIFHTDPKEYGMRHMAGYQEAELAYARSGYAWHRAAQGRPFIPHGKKGTWEEGNLQCASHPVFLEDEIRYYYAASNMLHKGHWELDPQRAGLGMASLKPDRFIALEAGQTPAELLTVGFKLPASDLFMNAKTAKDGWIKVELLDANTGKIKGFTTADCIPIRGDSIAHAVRWTGSGIPPGGTCVRLRISARNARIYSIYLSEPEEKPVYHRFYSR